MATERKDAERSSEPHAFWSGTISFGLVSVPVDLYPAVHSRRTAFRSFGPDGQPLRRRYVCSADGQALDRDDIVRAYEWDDGSFTPVSDEELEALAPRKSRDIELERFVNSDDIPLAMFDRSYVLAPSGESTKAYHLLATTMERRGLAGIARFVMRGREYLAAILAGDGLLRAETLRFAAEIRTPRDIGLPPLPKVSAGQRREYERAFDDLGQDDEIDFALLEDGSDKLLQALVERKAKAGKDVVEIQGETADDDEPGAEVIDIMSILKRRIGKAS